MGSEQPIEYERLIVPRSRRRSAPERSYSTVLKTSLSRLAYHALAKADVDTYCGRPKIEPAIEFDTLSVCLTAYNEDVAAYHSTLSALARAADHFVHAGEPKLSQKFTICILVDGLERMSGSFAAYAQRLGIYQPALLDGSADYHVFETSIDRHLLRYAPSELPDFSDPQVAARREAGVLTNLSESANRQNIVLFIKRDNRGKLDSHRCYFEVICRESRPAYFLQVDVGTVPDPDAVYEMWHRLQEDQRVAAVSARSHMPLPRNAGDVLGVWQYGDIATERILLWPTEVLMGYMCVLSGQLCLTRSDAVWNVPATEAAVREESRAETKPDTKVMQSYLRGLNRLGPFESNMFLAEDRILGLEIVFQPDSRWDLDYVPEANAQIDRCESWSELLAQRRRWLCSGVACRLWMFTRVSDYVSSANRSLGEKLRIFSASAFHSLYFLVQWLMPAFAAIIFASLHQGASAATFPMWACRLIDLMYAAVLGLQVVQIGLSAFCKLTEGINRFLNVSIGYQTLYVVVTAALTVFNVLARGGNTLPLLQLASAVAGVLLLARMYASEIFSGLAKWLFVYWASRPAVAFLIITHAALNSHDTSWGTKGLTRPHCENLDTARKKAAPRFTRRHFEWFRWKTVFLMSIANMALFAYATRSGWIATSRGFEVVLLLVLAQIAGAFAARFASLMSQSPSAR